MADSSRGADRAQRILDFLAEARRRKVYISVVAYIAISLAVLELGEAIVGTLQLPDATMPIITTALMLGFPVVVVLAWIFDITTKGVVRTPPRTDADRSRRGRPLHSDVLPSSAMPLPEARSATLRARSAPAPEPAAPAAVDPERVERAALGHLRHELRTPVNAIIGYSEMLIEDAGDEAIAKDLRQIRAAGRDLLTRIDGILSAEAWKSLGADADLEAFSARVHAELRTPVTTVVGYAEMVVETCRDTGRTELVPDVERILTAARRVLESTAGIVQAGTGAGADELLAGTAALTRDVLVRIRPVEPGSLAVEGEGRILVVDDNAMNRDLLLRQLARSGYIVDTAVDGIDALEHLAERAYDLILLDVLMPRMDGIETLGRIRADERLVDVPVLMLSSLDEVDSALRCIELGAEEYLPKPFQPTLLAARIAANMQLRRLRARDRAYSEHLASTREAVQRLTHAAFPDAVAERVLRGETGIVDSTASATALAFILPRHGRPASPAELVKLLDELAEAVSDAADDHDVDTVIMRPYGAVLVIGLPTQRDDHAVVAAALALDVLQRAPRCAAGLHSGAAAGGVVGAVRPHYDVWGEAVDTAEALAGGAPPAAALLSPSTHALVRERYALTAGAVTEVPGQGHMRSYVLRGPALIA